MVAAFPQYLRELQAGSIQHLAQPDLDKAVAVAAERKSMSGRLWDRTQMGPPGAAIVAANVALSAHDAVPIRVPIDITVAV
jgi:hypothetical protein